MLERGNLSNAAHLAEARRAPERVVQVLRAAVAAGGTSSATWGNQISAFRLMASAFLDILRHSSVFYRVYNDRAFVRVPFNSQLGAVFTGASASVVAPSAAIPVRRMDLAVASGLPSIKCAAIIAMTRELVDGTDGESLVSRSLRGSVAQAVDQHFINQILISGVPATPSLGSPLSDLQVMLTALAPTAESRLYLIAHPATAIRLATMGTASLGSPTVPSGQALFPGANPLGGELLGLPLLVSAVVPTNSWLMVDASGIAAASDPIELDTSEQGTLQMDDAPTMSGGATGTSPDAPTATTVVSMFQANLVGLKCVAWWNAAKIRPGGVAYLTGTHNW
jgi:hypothetical protein